MRKGLPICRKVVRKWVVQRSLLGAGAEPGYLQSSFLASPEQPPPPPPPDSQHMGDVGLRKLGVLAGDSICFIQALTSKIPSSMLQHKSNGHRDF